MEWAQADLQTLVLALLDARAPGATVCPSEVARALVAGDGPPAGKDGWRDAMPLVHRAVDALLADGSLSLSWKGKALPARTGPYRIGRGRKH